MTSTNIEGGWQNIRV